MDSGEKNTEQLNYPADFRDTVIGLHRKHVNAGLAKMATLMGTHVEVRSAGSYVFDERGEQYLDCGGYGVFILGHCHPVVVEAVKNQLGRHPLSSRLLLNAELATAAGSLASIAPRGLEYICFTNSGAEATEVGIKIARLNGKRRIIATQGGFHGKTCGALSVTGRGLYQSPFKPLLPDVEFIPFGDAGALAEVLSEGGEEYCFILEPVQAEGGVNIPPQGYLREVAQLCRNHGAFLILDEIQTGLGRLGAWWGADRENVVPDVLLVGKGLGGGVMPIGAAVVSAEAYQKLNADPILHTSTFAGNPLATTAARAAIEVIRDERIVERAQHLGATILAKLKEVLSGGGYPFIRELRGVGLLIGVEFEPEWLAGDFMQELLKRRVIVSYSLNAHGVIRLTPSAFLSEADVEWLVSAMRESADELGRRHRLNFKGDS